MPIQTILTQSIKLAQLISTGSIGESHTLELSQWLKVHSDLRGAFWHRTTMSYRAPKLAIIGTEPTFRTVFESALVTAGVRGPSVGQTNSLPFVITSISRQNWKCTTVAEDGTPLVSISLLEDFRLTITSTIPKASALLSTLGGYARVKVLFAGSRPAFSPCTGLPDLSGMNVTVVRPASTPMSGPFHLKPAPLAGSAVIPTSARIEFQPARVNWEYWNAPEGFGPMIVHEGYSALPSISK